MTVLCFFCESWGVGRQEGGRQRWARGLLIDTAAAAVLEEKELRKQMKGGTSRPLPFLISNLILSLF